MLDIPPGTFAHWRATGYFNVPAIRLGPRAIGFDLDLVEEWIAARPLAADAEAK